MTSKASTPEAEGKLDRGNGQTLQNRFENANGQFDESQATEEDPCLPVNNGTQILDRSKISGSDDSFAKTPLDFVECEKGERTYFTENGDDRPGKPGKNSKLSFVRNLDKDDWCECESKIRKKLGLTHCGFLTGLLLLCSALLFLLVIIVLGSTWPTTPHSRQFPICVKSTCLRSSALVLSKLDRAQDPCENFHDFACGALSKKHSKPPPGRSRWGPAEEMDFKLSEMIREVISVLPHQTNTNALTWKIKNFYDSCMSLDNIETDNERPLRKIINELGGWSVLRTFQVLSWEFGKTLVKVQDEYGATPFFAISTVPDPRNASRTIIRLSPSGLGLPDTSYYYREKDDRMSSSYRRYMKDVARQLGATSTDANSFSEDMFYFERRIAEVTPSRSQMEDIRTHQVETLGALKMLAPSVPLDEILAAMYNKANVDSETRILLPSNTYLPKISNIIATTDRSALNNYVIWNLVKEYLPYLSQNFQDIYSVYNREMTGATNLIDRWEFCVRTLQRFMGTALVAQIERSAQETNAVKNGDVVGDIFDSVRRVLKESITKARWIDLDLYKHYVHKVNNVTVQVGFPDTYLDSPFLEEYYSKLYVQKDNFFQNILYGVSYLKEDRRRRYVNPGSEYRWLPLVASESKVVHVPSINKVIVPQRLLLPPYYEPAYPAPVLYGSLGVQISRVLVSSLLTFTGLFASNGSLIDDRSLVANLTLTSIDHQLTCLVDLCVANDVVEGDRANKTSVSTFAEVSAVRQALKALKRASAEADHVHQAGLEEFDDESIFFMVYAQSLFSVKTAQEMDKDKTLDKGLDGRELLKIVRLQLKGFSEAFSCSPPTDYCKHML